MVMISELKLPGSKDRIPIVQLKPSACVKWLNPRRVAKGLEPYPVENTPERPSVEDLRNEIIDAVLNGTYSWQSQEVPASAATRDKKLDREAKMALWGSMYKVRVRKLAEALPRSNINVAAYHGRMEEVIEYLDAGLLINTKEKGYPGHSALHSAVVGNQLKMVEYLLDNNADPELPDQNENTPMHLAARWNRKEIIRLFVLRAPDTLWTKRNRSMKTALQLAKEQGHDQVIQLLPAQKQRLKAATRLVSGLAS